MKALILAAGLGTRLRPFTENTPKALFTISGRPLLDIIIHRLQEAGFAAVMINTHHLHCKIESFLAMQNYAIPVLTRHEPQILGTGGAIKNVADFWDDDPFLVINSDIVSNIDLKKVYNFHLQHDDPVTLVLFDDPTFNTVSVEPQGYIAGFHAPTEATPSLTPHPRKLTFTGIQVLDPQVLLIVTEKTFVNSIEIYKDLISRGKKIRAFIAHDDWKDIGTPERYKEAVIDQMARTAFQQVYPHLRDYQITSTRLRGDGSDRVWYRLTAQSSADADLPKTIVMADHGIRVRDTIAEVDSYVAIGKHLHAQGVPVPEIYLHDNFSGLVFVEDLGDLNLQTLLRETQDPAETIPWYRTIIDHLLQQFKSGAIGFDTAWTYQSAVYDKSLILERECRYFVNAFLKEYLGRDASFDSYAAEFSSLADKALEFAVVGFMHRDFQSRNIMISNGQPYFIDFQGGRIGPLQYDLASLLIDPYMDLPETAQTDLLKYCVDRLKAFVPVDKKDFLTGYKYCSITRNLQILGAFGYLSRVKKKMYFEKYIPPAVRALLRNLQQADFPKLKAIVEKITVLF
ncbi:sugar phosphate nucleotidyltransferase [Thermodesulfobacteriota bacterium]